MSKKITIITEEGSVSFHEICKLCILLLLGALCIVAALAINETIEHILQKYIKKDGILGYLLYTAIAIGLIILVVYLGCKVFPDLPEHIDLSQGRKF
jgi:uncharacterized membrane protein YdjX (TVP38/TMEM64 family)